VREVNGCIQKKMSKSFGPVLACVISYLMVSCTTIDRPRIPRAVFPSGAEFRLEIAADDPARQRGYMFREHVAADEGMLFIFDEPGQHPFWMKNCKVNLDIIWLDEARRVVEIAHDRPPCPEVGECPSIFPMRIASSVLEVAGGIARQEGLTRGDTVTLHLESPEEP